MIFVIFPKTSVTSNNWVLSIFSKTTFHRNSNGDMGVGWRMGRVGWMMGQRQLSGREWGLNKRGGWRSRGGGVTLPFYNCDNVENSAHT